MMKRLFLVIGVVMMSITGAMAQGLPELPQDPEVRKGVLPNGMTYYVRHNAKPEGQAEFYIFHNVGAVQEEDSQIGLAHFLEHMAFNGTAYFPDKGIINWLETIGVKFGVNLNASTGQDRTIYNVSAVPVSRESIVDSCLMILHEWSHFIALLPGEIDSERGVIVEELRARNSAGWRLFEKSLPYLYGEDNRYGVRNVIGTEEHLRTFSHKEIVDFYHRWYRPDLQAIIVVGDIDADAVVAKIEKMMADIPAVANAPEKEVIQIEDNDEPIIAVLTDPELTGTSVEMYIKREAMPASMNNTMLYPIMDWAIEYVTDIANERLNDIESMPGAPFTSAGVGNGNLIPTCDVFQMEASARDGEALRAFEALYTEVVRIAQHGVTIGEFERAKENMLRRVERQWDGRNDRRNSYYVYQYISNYRENSPIMSSEDDYDMDKQVLNSIVTVDVVKAIASQLITDYNQVVLFNLPEKSTDVPTVEQIREIIDRVNNTALEAKSEDVVAQPLIPAKTKLKGSKVKTTTTDLFGATVWTLKNGITIVVKPTDFKADEVLVNIVAAGGQSLFGNDMMSATATYSMYQNQAGLGAFTQSELRKQLAGKSVSLYPSMYQYTAGFSGSASPKDLETLMQLIYLSFTAPRFNNDAFAVVYDQLETALKNQAENPQSVLIDSLFATMYNHNPRMQNLKVERLPEITLKKYQDIFKAVYSNPADFTFTFVGNVDLNTLQPLVEKYLGSLKSGKNKSHWIDRKVRFYTGEVTNRFTGTMKMPKSTIIFTYNGAIPYTLSNSLAVDALSQILDTRYLASIRETLGGAYSPQVQGDLQNIPNEQYQLLVYIDTDPKLADQIIPMITAEIREVAENGVTEEELAKIKEYYMKERADDIKLNGYWIRTLRDLHIEGVDFETGYDAAVAALTTADIQAIAKKIIADDNIMQLVMEPKAE